jgi:hypothetical protein
MTVFPSVDSERESEEARSYRELAARRITLERLSAGVTLARSGLSAQLSKTDRPAATSPERNAGRSAGSSVGKLLAGHHASAERIVELKTRR